MIFRFRWVLLCHCLLAASFVCLVGGCPQEGEPDSSEGQTPVTEAPSQGIAPEAQTKRPNGLNFQNIQTDHKAPYRVQFTFTLRDNKGNAIELSESDLHGASAPIVTIWEDDSPLDPYECQAFLHTAPDLEMDVAFVLDFSSSMVNLGGVPSMLEAMRQMMTKLKPSHRVLVEEFHDRRSGSDHSVLVPFTFADSANIETINETVDEFASKVYHGFSTCWDATFEALVQFGVGRDPNRVRHLYVFTDGHDTSSESNMWTVIALAQTLGVKVYTVGLGVLYPQDEDELQFVGGGTGGGYFSGANADALSRHVAGTADNLGGNYKLAYITPSINDFRTQIHLTWSEVRTSDPINRRVRIGGIEGNDRKGRLYFMRGPENEDGEVSIMLMANHIPRDIGTLRLKAGAADQTVSVYRTQLQEGGILRGWGEFAPESADTNAWVSAKGRTLGFGDFGPVCEIVVKYPQPTAAGSPSPAIPFELDNSSYSEGVRFELVKVSNGGIVDGGNIQINDIPSYY